MTLQGSEHRYQSFLQVCTLLSALRLSKLLTLALLAVEGQTLDN